MANIIDKFLNSMKLNDDDYEDEDDFDMEEDLEEERDLLDTEDVPDADMELIGGVADGDADVADMEGDSHE